MGLGEFFLELNLKKTYRKDLCFGLEIHDGYRVSGLGPSGVGIIITHYHKAALGLFFSQGYF